MLILQKVDTGESFEITWIYDRGDQGYFLRAEGAKDALKWAARTYVVAALGSLATLLYFILMFLGRR